MISLNAFISYLVQKIKIFRNEDELSEMKKLFAFIFHQFDEDKSGLLEFNEIIICFCTFDTKNKSRFFFDYADKDKSETLELDELNQLLDQFPLIFNNNAQIKNLKYCLLHKKNKSLTKSEFLNLLDENKRKKINLVDEQLLDKDLIDSVILNNCQEYDNLMKLCDFENQKWKLIYRASGDGFRAEGFHLKCNDHFNTLTLIKAKNCALFGGYASRAWSSTNDYLTDEFSFIFVQNIKANVNIIKQNVGLMNNAKLGPCFESDLLQISNLSNLNNQSKMNIDLSDIFKFLFDLTDKDKNNTLDEDEIREIFEEMPVEIKELIYKIKQNTGDNESEEENDDLN
ncbi:unnamed protein product [Brachionus calyciflorus]|uniref:Uncharacterized protein n=1 Tax=Brachionus calyciflorus TaxID=104777 RepID=A0A813U5X4_9BILA|nr:unnamed protein product [Brachionus calyciflorus]